MLNNPNEWHNIEDEENEQPVISAETTPNKTVDNSRIKVIAIIGIVAILFAVALALFNKVKSNNEPAESIPQYQENQQEAGLGQDTDTLANQDTETVEIPIDAPASSNESGIPGQVNKMTPTGRDDSVLVAVGGEGRENPFVPYINTIAPTSGAYRGGYSGGTYSSGNYRGSYGIPFDVIEPPHGIVNDAKAESLMATTVSGILYDSREPSAIINYKGEDQMVRKGDKLSNFTILDITKSKVVVKSGSNIYMASVGQTLQDDNVYINEVYNLQRKFGGTYANQVPRGILIKPTTIKPN